MSTWLGQTSFLLKISKTHRHLYRFPKLLLYGACHFAWNFYLFLVYKSYFLRKEPTFFFKFRDIFLWSYSMCFDKLWAFFYFCVCMRAKKWNSANLDEEGKVSKCWKGEAGFKSILVLINMSNVPKELLLKRFNFYSDILIKPFIKAFCKT